ncbi:MAG TPA: S8 family serine peptidase, partial [Gaiellaceae bacterium]|nr:S8 family serine peptidase [Gaiellaceae bacterium]
MKRFWVALPGVLAAALIAASSAAAFTPSNPFYGKQWYLNQDNAFDAWPAPPPLDTIKVAIVDSGVDCALPDFKGQIAASKSFVGGNACMDTEGHGTIVAGEIAGSLNTQGVVGLAWSSQLLVAKVVATDGTIPLKAEASAIRWAANQGAGVINLSFGGVRDPMAPSLDTYSKAEAQAVAYAVKRGAVVVAAVGNADEAYATPWEFASWPSALPHVLGVGALTKSGNVPEFSDRDPNFVDVAAPGVGIFSTFPANLTSKLPSCQPQGYTDCATGDYHKPEGTSFAAPQVSAAAAVLLGLDPTLTNSQVTTLL